MSLELSEEEDSSFKVTPIRSARPVSLGAVADHSDKSEENDEEPPKPTQEVLMSRNLRGGTGKGFNFALDDDSDDGKKKE